MDVGVRNQLTGTIKSIKSGDVMSQVTLQVGDYEVTSVMTTDSLLAAGFKEGEKATALVKAINVVLIK